MKKNTDYDNYSKKDNKMGCFSFLCKECGKGINSSSFDGEKCRLYWLKDGKVHQKMRGPYDSYGRVFTRDLDDNYLWSNQKEPMLGSDALKVALSGL